MNKEEKERQRIEKERIRKFKQKEKEARKALRESKKNEREARRKERDKKREFRNLSKLISINPDINADLEHSYNIPEELLVNKDNILCGDYVVIATNDKTEKIAIFKKNYDDKHGLVFLHNCGVYLFPYYQMRKYIKGYDRTGKEFKTSEILLNKFDNSVYKMLLYSKIKRKK